MASGLFIDPLVALRIAPLISSTCTLLFARDQHFFLSIFNENDHRKLSKPLLSSYFKTFFNRGVVGVLAFIGISSATGIANLLNDREALFRSNSWWWYTAGAALSSSHLLYAPVIMSSVNTLMEPRPGTDINKALDEWLSINKLRGLTVDLAAWLAFGIAVTKTLHV